MSESSPQKESPKEVGNMAKVLVMGTFGPDDITIEMTDRRIDRGQQLEQKIKEEWASRAAKGWFPGPLVRLEKFNLSMDGKLSLILGETDFKEYIGSRDLESLRRFGYEGIANPLSTSSVLVTSDQKIIVIQKLRGDASGSIDVLGGYVHPEKDIDPTVGKLSLFKAAKREIAEEAGVKEGEISELWCLGLSYEYANLCHPVASFVAKTSLSSIEIKKRHQMGEVEVIVVEPERLAQSENEEYVIDLLRDHYPNIEPDGRVSIALARRWLSGRLPKKEVKRQINQIENHSTRRISEAEPEGKIRFIGFDLDGTLIDTMSEHKIYFGRFIKNQFGIDPQEAGDHYFATAGKPTAEQISSLLTKKGISISLEKSVQLGQVIDSELETIEAKPFPEILNLLKDLKKDGYHLFVCSSHPTLAVGRILEKSELLPFVDFFIGTDPEKPKLKKGETHFREVANHFQVPYETFVKKAVFIGDGISDIQAANETGIVGIGRIGTKTKEELIAAKAHTALKDFSKLPKIIKSL